MKNFGELVKFHRQLMSLSQRQLAKETKISFRQIQRIEGNETQPSLALAQRLLQFFGLILSPQRLEPRWALLQEQGLPLIEAKNVSKSYSTGDFRYELIHACLFVYDNARNSKYGRHRDALKALLLSLKTHFPTHFASIKNKLPRDALDFFELDKISGRDIKLRKLALHRLAQNYRNSKLKLHP